MPDPIPFAGATLDRAAHRRGDEAWLREARSDPRARAVVGGRRGVLLDGSAPALVALDDDREPVLLGVREDGSPLFALEAAPQEELTGLRESVMTLAPGDAGLLAYAQQLLHWHRTHRFCGICGLPTVSREGGHSRACSGGHTTHPRTDPVVIMLVTDGRDRVLLGRQPSWPAGRYSALAGFVEPGESLEAAVAREVREEAGVEVRGIRYQASQPWPFPASLMLGFEAEYAGGEASAADDELEDVRWFTPEELEAEEGRLMLPPPLAIARHLLDGWLRV